MQLISSPLIVALSGMESASHQRNLVHEELSAAQPVRVGVRTQIPPIFAASPFAVAVRDGAPIPDATSPVLLDTVESVMALSERLVSEAHFDSMLQKPVIAVDLEGVDLCRNGRVCILTVATAKQVYLVDITKLGASAFAAGAGGLKVPLSSDDLVKLLFDCRADADALFHLYGVPLGGVCDLQVMCTLHICPKAEWVIGMKNAFGKLQLFSEADTTLKMNGVMLFAPEKGGSYEVWDKRPLPDLLVKYCAIDVKFFFVCFHKLNCHAKKAFEVGKLRVARQIDAVNFVKDRSMVFRDF